VIANCLQRPPGTTACHVDTVLNVLPVQVHCRCGVDCAPLPC
jgi:hypothetical protein